MPRDSYEPTYHAIPIPHWRGDHNGVAARFSGRVETATHPSREAVLRYFDEAPANLAWAEQCHSATVLRADRGSCGRGDALWTQRADLALSIVTADCVPVICGGDGVLAAIHAGWRGLVAGTIQATLAALPVPARLLDAWLGPAIGPCCYEVGRDVAEEVIASSEPAVATADGAGKAYLDLHRAAEFQLRGVGVERVHRVDACTRCRSDVLWSYRGSSGANGRNLTVAWLAAT